MDASAKPQSVPVAPRRWIPTVLAYAAAWWLPVSPLWALQHPGAARPDGIDGPLSWMWKDEWGRPGSPTGFQLLIPLGVALLIWDRRRALQTLDVREGGPLPLLAGCLALIVAHLIHLPALAFAALIGIGIGALVMVWGAPAVRTLKVPLLYWLLMLPPPASTVSRIADLVSVLTMRVAALFLKILHRPAQVGAHRLDLGGSPLEVGYIHSLGSGGTAVVLTCAALLLTYGLHRRRSVSRILALVGAGAALGFLVNALRVAAAALLHPGSIALSERVRDIDAWLLVIPTVLGVILFDRRFVKLERAS